MVAPYYASALHVWGIPIDSSATCHCIYLPGPNSGASVPMCLSTLSQTLCPIGVSRCLPAAPVASPMVAPAQHGIALAVSTGLSGCTMAKLRSVTPNLLQQVSDL